jgi:hypothetical protein
VDEHIKISIIRFTKARSKFSGTPACQQARLRYRALAIDANHPLFRRQKTQPQSCSRSGQGIST